MWYNSVAPIQSKKSSRRITLLISHNISYSHTTKCVIALGCFDGVHLGHTAVIKKALDKSKEQNIPCCIWSFSEPPKKFYQPDSAPLLTDAEEKARILSDLGVDIYISIKFDQFISNLTPYEFFDEYLLKKLNPVCIVCGYDFTFGKHGSGNTQTLSDLCTDNNVSFISVSPVDIDGIPVSSSAIREYLSNGNIERANSFLGRNYSITSSVINGKHLGRTLGFPTINQRIAPDICTPAHGVYLTQTILNEKKYYGITNVGTQPTVGGTQVIFETNIFDFSGDLYGQNLRIEFIHFIRRERKFDSVAELSKQVHSDISNAKSFLMNYKK